MDHGTSDYPHDGGCGGCRDSRVCNVCGDRITMAEARCTNGRCLPCHRDVCTPGGERESGHGYGSEVRARAVIERIRLSQK